MFLVLENAFLLRVYEFVNANMSFNRNHRQVIT